VWKKELCGFEVRLRACGMTAKRSASILILIYLATRTKMAAVYAVRGTPGLRFISCLTARNSELNAPLSPSVGLAASLCDLPNGSRCWTHFDSSPAKSRASSDAKVIRIPLSRTEISRKALSGKTVKLSCETLMLISARLLVDRTIS
jgi:hypothetical protein